MKTKILLSSILLIALCVSVIAGSTFALFTNTSEVNIAANAANVNVVATTVGEPTVNGTYATATVDGNVVTLNNIAPGESVTVSLGVKNESTIPVKYRIIVDCTEDKGLYPELDITASGVAGLDFNGFSSKWVEIPVDNTAANATLSITLALPNDAACNGASCRIAYRVEAIQANAPETEAYDGLYEENGVYYVNNYVDLKNFAIMVNNGETFSGKTVMLTSDVDLRNLPWTPIGLNADGANKFAGTFDGQNHTISNLFVDTAPSYTAAGFFGALNGDLKNLTIENAKISHVVAASGASSNGVAVVAGSLYSGANNDPSIDNVTVKNATVVANRLAGGIAGYVYGSVTNCTVENITIVAVPDTFSGSYDNGDKVGGIIGYGANHTTSDFQITGNKVSNAIITAYRDLGGIAGGSYLTTTNNTVENIKLVVDQTTNYYGAKAENAAAIVGRPMGSNDQTTGNASSKVEIVGVRTVDQLAKSLVAGVDKVVLGADITLGTDDLITVPAEANVTLDLNGHTISQKKTQTTAHALINNKGTLTINDSTGNGAIVYEDTGIGGEYTSNTISNYGTLNVYGGTIMNESSATVKSNGYPHAIDVYQGSTTNIYGGTVCSKYYDAIRMFCNSATQATTVNIYGGTIINRVTLQDPSASVAGYGVLNIEGGTFIVSNPADQIGKPVNANVRLLNFSNNCTNTKATITGGTFDTGVMIKDNSSAQAAPAMNGWLTVSGSVTAVATADPTFVEITNVP